MADQRYTDKDFAAAIESVGFVGMPDGWAKEGARDIRKAVGADNG